MRRSIRTCLTSLAIAAAAAAAPADAESQEEILAGYVEARGGAANLRAVESLRGNGRLLMGGGAEAPFRYEWKRPDRFRFELTVQGMTDVQAFDGTDAWTIDPPGQTEPADMAPLDLALLNDAVDFLGPLVDHAAKGTVVELVGKTEVEGTEAWELAVTRPDGGRERSFLDVEYLLEFQQVEIHPTPGGGELELEITWGDYKEVAGVLLPHSWSRRPKGAPDGISAVFDEIEVNPEIADDRFARPEGDG